ncbi:hypothetical protein MARPU_08485 [Marichromatium purpuratum 984]|uniref:DUF2946 domain-containing protein n=1 Tax=Marichromatium purpuratum 984 TaxID=765910 RepID=W0E8C0_MARPU|nr:hypothetical protein [Marichromatium purpuratum]AHF05479.1 hypothetical protein MARPU_08485 [Marichromatium purpuratum 984]
MNRSRHALLPLLVLCLLALQAQTVAARALDCLHFGAPAAEIGCPGHPQPAGGIDQQPTAHGGGGTPLDCAKCALALTLGVLQAPPTTLPLQLADRGAVHRPRPPVHFYLHDPEHLLRPPRTD